MHAALYSQFITKVRLMTRSMNVAIHFFVQNVSLCFLREYFRKTLNYMPSLKFLNYFKTYLNYLPLLVRNLKVCLDLP